MPRKRSHTLVGPRLRLRALEDDDLKPIVAFAQDPRVTEQLVNFRLPISESEERSFLKKAQRGRNDRMYSMVSKRGAFVGCLGFHDIDWVDRSAEFGLVVANPRVWGRGYGAESGRLGLMMAFERLNLNRLEVPVLETHTVARGLYEVLGFQAEATLREKRFVNGRFVDVILFALLAREYDGDAIRAALFRRA